MREVELSLNLQISRLERANVFLRGVVVSGVVAGGLFLLMGQSQPVASDFRDVVRTRSVVLVNDAGKPTVVLDSDATFGRIRIFNEKGDVLAQMDGGAAGGSLALWASNAKLPAVVLGIAPAVGAFSMLANGRGDPTLICSSTEAEGSSLTLCNRFGKNVVVLSSKALDAGAIATASKDGNVLTLLGSAADRTGGTLMIADNAGKEAVVVGVREDGPGEIQIADPRGQQPAKVITTNPRQ
ncbi:MAG: hypothetical protein SF069_00495 [Phycisphaerae bacterium]|nr:hypothetical protein [Phycisphaerae bacterium]